jgi:hypothetical protein
MYSISNLNRFADHYKLMRYLSDKSGLDRDTRHHLGDDLKRSQKAMIYIAMTPSIEMPPYSA